MTSPKRLLASEHQAGPFPAHGDATVAVQGRVMRFVASGPWNVEFVNALWRAMVKAAAQLPPDGRYVDLIEIRHSALMTPEALAALHQAIDTAVARGFNAQATALVLAPDVEGRALMLPKLQRIYSRHRPVSVHDTVDEAWVALRAAVPEIQGDGTVVGSGPSA
jgi:hypothetical protein